MIQPNKNGKEFMTCIVMNSVDVLIGSTEHVPSFANSWKNLGKGMLEQIEKWHSLRMEEFRNEAPQSRKWNDGIKNSSDV